MKVKTKVLIMLVVAIFAMLLIGATKVEAVVSEDTLNSVLPDEMSVDIPEIEYKKAREILTQKVKEIFKEKNYDYEGLELSVNDTENVYLGIDGFHEFRVCLYREDKENYENSVSYTSKYIKLVYNNTKNYNSTDAQVAKNVKLPSKPEYFTMDFEKSYKSKDIWNYILDSITEYYQNKNNDTTIKFVASTGLGGFDDYYYGTESLQIGIFKNNVLYDVRTVGNANIIFEMTIPSNVGNTETDYINYAKPIIEKYWNDNVNLKKCEKFNNLTLEDGYMIDNSCAIILKKTKVDTVDKSVIKQDTSTGVKLESNTDVLPQDVVLDVKPLTTGNVYSIVEKSLGTGASKFVLYDITLKQNNKDIQPNGKVKISIPVPTGYDTSKIAVYRIAEDGTKTEYAITIKDGYITFETDHFSTYVVAQKTNNTGNSNTETTTPTPNKGELDETPKTGTTDNLIYILPIAILSATGIIVLKRKETK